MLPIVLGSQSPRRKEILEYFSIPFIQVCSFFDESSVPYSGNSESYAIAVSEGKAKTLMERYSKHPILTADSVVSLNEKLYEKPKNEEEAFSFLLQFSGCTHHVYTGVTLIFNDEIISDVEHTEVLFNELNEEQIHRYLRQNLWRDKAGGYTIQNYGGLLVKEIKGCYYNVMGFPINTVAKLLRNADIDIWHHLKER